MQRLVPEAPAGLLTAFTLGYKSSTLGAYNGDVDFSRVSLGLHEHLRFAERFRIGLGVVWEPDVRLATDLRGVGGGDADFRDAFGLRLSGEWAVARRIALGLRATLIEYEFDGGPEGGERLDGNSIGFSVGVRLR